MKNIIKKLYILILTTIILIAGVNPAKSESSDENPKIRKGTFVRVQPREEYSSLNADIEDEVSFINMQDMYVYETNAIPEGTIFYGEIEDVREPVVGRDGSLKISIYKMMTPEKKIYKISGHLYSENDNYIGGKETAKIYYHRVPHYIQGLRPFLQAAPMNIYEEGKHTIIRPGEEMYIVIEEDIILK